MKIVILTDKNILVESILNEFATNEIEIDAIIIEEASNNSAAARIKKILPVFIINTLRSLRGFDRVRPCESINYYKKYSKNIFRVINFNSADTELILRKLKPEIIVLGGSRIIKEHIINIPEIGILNAHPGLLPKYRGVDVLQWSIYNDDPIGVTVHFIDKGVDTGGICKQEEIPIRKNDTLELLKSKANSISGKLMARVVKGIINNNSEPIKENKLEEGKQFYKMDADKLKIVKQKLMHYE